MIPKLSLPNDTWLRGRSSVWFWVFSPWGSDFYSVKSRWSLALHQNYFILTELLQVQCQKPKLFDCILNRIGPRNGGRWWERASYFALIFNSMQRFTVFKRTRFKRARFPEYVWSKFLEVISSWRSFTRLVSSATWSLVLNSWNYQFAARLSPLWRMRSTFFFWWDYLNCAYGRYNAVPQLGILRSSSGCYPLGVCWISNRLATRSAYLHFRQLFSRCNSTLGAATMSN